MRTTPWTRAVVLLLALPVAAAAQPDQIAALAPRCPTGAVARVDTSDVIVGVWPSATWKDRKYDAAQQQRIRYYADAIRQHFTPPASLGELPVLSERLADRKTRDDGSRSVIEGRLALIVKPDGRVDKLAWERVPLSVPLANAITQAAMAADASGDFDGIPRGRNALDTLSVTIDSRTGDLPPGAAALMRARVIGYVVDRLPTRLEQMTPEYPAQAKANFAGNKATVQFIIGTDGRAVMSSFQVTRTDWADFEAPMREAIATGRYRPAESGGCAVPWLAWHPFEFKLRLD